MMSLNWACTIGWASRTRWDDRFMSQIFIWRSQEYQANPRLFHRSRKASTLLFIFISGFKDKIRLSYDLKWDWSGMKPLFVAHLYKILCTLFLYYYFTLILITSFIYSGSLNLLRILVINLINYFKSSYTYGVRIWNEAFSIFSFPGYPSPTFEVNWWSTFVQSEPSLFGAVVNFTGTHSMTYIYAQFMNN